LFCILFSYELPIYDQSDIPSSICLYKGSALRNGDVFFFVVFAFFVSSCVFSFFVAFFSLFGAFGAFLNVVFSFFSFYVSS